MSGCGAGTGCRKGVQARAWFFRNLLRLAPERIASPGSAAGNDFKAGAAIIVRVRVPDRAAILCVKGLAKHVENMALRRRP
jgi:hypothetical protein